MASNVVNLVILLLLLVLSVSDARVFLSIDCGATDTYTDDKKIQWSPDDAYIKTGESHGVSFIHATTQTELNTLRVFKTSPESCYSINVDKGGQVLVRATFFYGNYDGQYTPPTFDLQLNGKHWGTVVASSSMPSSYEVVTVADEGLISVCLIQTFAGEFPFISALELRSLGANMYSPTIVGDDRRANGNGDDSNNNKNFSPKTGRSRSMKSKKSKKKSKKKGKKGKKTGTIVGPTVAIFILLVAAAVVIVIWRRKRKAAMATAMTGNIAMAEHGEAPMLNGMPNRSEG